MIQVLPGDTRESLLAQALGQGAQGIEKNYFRPAFQNQMEYNVQSSRLQNALQGLNEPGFESLPYAQKLSRLAPLLLSPGGGQLLSKLAPALLTQTAAKRAQDIPKPGGLGGETPTASTTETSDGKPGFTQQTGIDAILNQLKSKGISEPSETPGLFKGTLEPGELGMGPIPKTYSEQQILQAEQGDIAKGLLDAPTAQMMRNYNQEARSQIGDLYKAAEIQANISEQVRGSQEAFRDALKNRLGIQDPSDLAVAETIASRPEYRNIANDAIRAERVAKEFENYQASKDAFKSGSGRPNPVIYKNEYDSRMKSLSSKFNALAKYGQREKQIADLADQGWSESEIANITNPLDSDVSSKIEKLPKFPKVTTFGLREVGPTKKDVQLRENAQKKWESFLTETIKPGAFDPKNPDVIKPGPSLILIRNKAIQNGMNPRDFDATLNALIDSGKIKLDPIQANERQMMTESPSRVWSLYEFIFGTK